MNTKLYTYKDSIKSYKFKSVIIALLLTGILFSMYSCQHEAVPIGVTVPIGASSTLRTN